MAAEFVFDDAKDDATFVLDVVRVGDPDTKYRVGKQSGRAARKIRVVELPDTVNMPRLAEDIACMLSRSGDAGLAMNSAVAKNLRQAQKAARGEGRPQGWVIPSEGR